MRIGGLALRRAKGRFARGEAGRRPWLVALSVSIFALVGCAHADSVADRQMVEMREAIGEIQAERDRAGESIDVEPAQADVRTAPATPAPTTPAPIEAALPPMRTVHIGDGGGALEPADPNDPSRRPEIRLYGSSRPRGSAREKARSELRIEAAADGDSAWKAPRTTDPGSEAQGMREESR